MLVIFSLFILNIYQEEINLIVYKRLEVILDLRNYNGKNFTIVNRIIISLLDIFNKNDLEYKIKDKILAIELYRIIKYTNKIENEKYLFILKNLEKNVYLNNRII
jgi:hypothetical protein